MPSRIPTPAEVLNKLREGIFRDLHVSMTARVISYDSDALEVTVQPVPADSFEDETGSIMSLAFPQIVGVPWGCIEAGGCHVRVTPSAGDYCTLVFTDRSLDAFLARRTETAPEDTRRHALSDAIAYPLFSSIRPSGLPSGVVSLGANTGSDDWVALASKVSDQLNALKNAVNAWTPVPNDGGAALKAALTALFTTWPGSVASASVNVRG